MGRGRGRGGYDTDINNVDFSRVRTHKQTRRTIGLGEKPISTANTFTSLRDGQGETHRAGSSSSEEVEDLGDADMMGFYDDDHDFHDENVSRRNREVTNSTKDIDWVLAAKQDAELNKQMMLFQKKKEEEERKRLEEKERQAAELERQEEERRAAELEEKEKKAAELEEEKRRRKAEAKKKKNDKGNTSEADREDKGTTEEGNDGDGNRVDLSDGGDAERENRANTREGTDAIPIATLPPEVPTATQPI